MTHPLRRSFRATSRGAAAHAPRLVSSALVAIAALGCGSNGAGTGGAGGSGAGTGTGTTGAGAGGASSSSGGGGAGGVVQLAKAHAPWGLAVDDADVFWTSFDDGTVERVSKAGGPTSTLATGQTQPTAIALGVGAAWVGVYAGLAKVELDGSGASMFAPTPVTHAVTVRGNTVYFSAGPNIQSVPMAGGTPSTLGAGSSFVLAIAVDAAHVFWTASAGEVQRIPLGGGAITTLASFQKSPYGIAVDDVNVYWSNQGVAPDYDGAILKTPLDGSGAAIVLAPHESQPMGIVLDGATLYWVDHGGSVRKMPAAGGAATSLHEGGPGPAALAVDATSVYWANDVEGTIEKTKK